MEYNSNFDFNSNNNIKFIDVNLLCNKLNL